MVYFPESNTDWDSQVVIGAKHNAPRARVTKGNAKLSAWFTAAFRAAAFVSTSKKTNGGSNSHIDPDYQKIAKLARDTDAAPPPKLSLAVSEVIRTIRAANGLSQKDLAAKINEKQSVLQDYESGKAIPNTQILGKLERILGVKLRGNDIGKELPGHKSKSAPKPEPDSEPKSVSKSNSDPQPTEPEPELEPEPESEPKSEPDRES
ncbi:hypothetical protein CTheo_394 [Ceratobasidium theobromae]|uniref:HTH cro/C1-type domain-containing protein n=1 Tax=Ceratobasidium theobromae TaxID=1582974 RepID=A0A5N5QWJ5_9AGAM|nr:hypothetical protein CTheo_394 [Ceratobasidium theobromae]